MEIIKKQIFNHCKILVFVLALAFSSQSNATNGITNLAITGSNISYLNAASMNIHTLTSGGSNWDSFVAWLKQGKKKKKKKRGRLNKGPQKRERQQDSKTTSIPLDGGLGILLLGAAAFGIRKLRGNKEK